MSGFRRIVTGHNDAGRSIVIEDTPTPNVNGFLHNFWTLSGAPCDVDGPDPMKGDPHGLHPPKNGIMFRFFQIPPRKMLAHMSDEEQWEFARQRFIAMGAEDALVDRERHPAMHKTHTVDFIVLLSGEVTLLLDEADVPMKPFDVVVQRGTNHAWENNGDELAVLVDGA